MSDCPICFDEYKSPVAITCGHTFCGPCIREYINNKEMYFLPCPVCRRIFYCADLRTNILLAEKMGNSLIKDENFGIEGGTNTTEILNMHPKVISSRYCKVILAELLVLFFFWFFQVVLAFQISASVFFLLILYWGKIMPGFLLFFFFCHISPPPEWTLATVFLFSNLFISKKIAEALKSNVAEKERIDAQFGFK